LELTISGYLKKCKLSDLVTTEPEMAKWLGQTHQPSLAPVAGGLKTETSVNGQEAGSPLEPAQPKRASRLDASTQGA
jgi:hypothetical protein